MKVKKWEDCSAKELVEIYNSEDWKAFLETQFAFAKIPFLPPDPGMKPEKISEPKDRNYWSVGGICFANKKDAGEVFSLVSSKKIVNATYRNSDFYTLEDLDVDNYSYPKLESRFAYSDETYYRIKDEISSYKKRESGWEELNKNYKEVKGQQEEILETILEIVQLENEKTDRYTHMEQCYNRYLKLSSGQTEIALNFLSEAYPAYKTEFPDFFELAVIAS